MQRFLAALDWVPVNGKVARVGGELARRYRPSHSGIEDVDYLIAATALLLDAELLTTNVRRGAPLLVRISDTASGIDPASLVARMDGRERPVLLRGGVARISTAGLAPGKHRLRFQVSDYQESRNMENVPAILPNTRVLSATVVVHRQRHA